MRIYNPKQADVILHADARWNILAGAVSSGKTFISYDLMAKRCLEQGPGNSLLVGKTLTTIRRNVINPMRERFGSAVSEIDGYGNVYLFGRRFYAVGANDEKALKKIQGLSLVYCNGDEFATWPKSFFDMLKSRLRQPGARFDGTCNPEGPLHWAKTELIDRAAELDLKYWHFVLDDNCFLDPGYVDAIKKEYTGVWYQRYILGMWIAAEGAVYDMFDSAVHVVDELPAFERYWVGVDYGTTNPTVYLLIGQSGQGLYVIDEWRYDSVRAGGRQKTDGEYSADFIRWLDSLKVQPVSVFIDPSAASFTAQLSMDYRRLGRRNNLAHADNTVLDGIRRTASLLSSKRLFIHNSCKGLIDEVTSYVWDSKKTETGEDVPVKMADHGPDALRYVVNGTRGIWEAWLRRKAA